MLITRAAGARAIFTKAVFVMLLFAGVAAGQSNQSVYTSLEVKQCRVIKTADRGDYEGRCRGVAGYALLVSEGDLRQNVTVVTPQGTTHSLDVWEVVSGGFSSVGPKAEWRMARQNGKLAPVAVIIRYNASEIPTNPTSSHHIWPSPKSHPRRSALPTRFHPAQKQTRTPVAPRTPPPPNHV